MLDVMSLSFDQNEICGRLFGLLRIRYGIIGGDLK